MIYHTHEDYDLGQLRAKLLAEENSVNHVNDRLQSKITVWGRGI
jgi:hypothetical protein